MVGVQTADHSEEEQAISSKAEKLAEEHEVLRKAMEKAQGVSNANERKYEKLRADLKYAKATDKKEKAKIVTLESTLQSISDQRESDEKARPRLEASQKKLTEEKETADSVSLQSYKLLVMLFTVIFLCR
jgi:chromosome segregation ATPase